jgi:hypothetical protein
MRLHAFLRCSHTCSDKHRRSRAEINSRGRAETCTHAESRCARVDRDRRNAATKPRDGVHQASRYATPLDRDDVVERSPDVRVVEPLEQTEAGERKQDDAHLRRPSRDEQKRYAAEQAESLRQHSAAAPQAMAAPREAVSHPATRKHAKHRCGLQVGRRVQAPQRQAHMEAIMQEARQPRKEDDRDEVCTGKDRHQQNDVAIAEGTRNALEEREPLRTHRRRGTVDLAASRLSQCSKQHYAKQKATAAEEQKTLPPAVVLAHISREIAASDAAHVDA